MTDHERNLLIGRGGRIRTRAEQEDARFNRRNMRVLKLSEIEVTERAIRMIASDSVTELGVDLETFAQLLGSDGWTKIVRARKNSKVSLAS
jgi:hypothetical protein